MNEITRPKLIAAWFALLALIVMALGMAGVRMTFETGAFLVALALIPPVLVLRFWPSVDTSETVGEVLRGHRDR